VGEGGGGGGAASTSDMEPYDRELFSQLFSFLAWDSSAGRAQVGKKKSWSTQLYRVAKTHRIP